MKKANSLVANTKSYYRYLSFTLYSLKRDLPDFTAFSTQFSEQYVTETEAMIKTVEKLLEPQAETLALRMISQTMEQKLNDLKKLLLHTEGYLKLMKNVHGVTPATFGVSALRKSMYSSDYEGVLKGVKVLLSNMQNLQAALQSKGMPATMPQTFQTLHDNLALNKEKQFEIKSNRAGIVQNNIQELNNLYLRISEIYKIGKVLYKNTEPAKYADYTFSALLKKVRNVSTGSTTNVSTKPEQAMATSLV